MPRAAWLALLVAAACAGPSRPEAAPRLADELPARFEEGPAKASTAQDALADDWWTDFQAAELNDWVAAVLDANPDLLAASARLRQAEAAARAANGARWPSLSAGANAARSRQNLIGIPIPGAGDVLTVHSTQLGLSLDVGWELDLWGRIAAAAEAAEADFLASQADWHAARVSLAGQTVKAWLAREEARLQHALAEGRIAVETDRVVHLGERFRRGRVDADAVLRAEAAALQARSTASALRLAVAGQERALRVLTGRYPTAGASASSDIDSAAEVDPTADLAPVADASPELPALPPPPPPGMPAELLQRRPDLLAAEARLLAADARAREARAALYPRLALTASGGTASNEVGDLLDGDFRVWSLAGNLTAPLFQGGRLRARAAGAYAGAEAAAWDFAHAVLRALAEVEGALQAEAALREQLTHARATEQRALATLEVAERRFRTGAGPLLDALDARAAVLEARSGRLTRQLSLLQNRVDLCLALGGGFQVDGDDPR